MNAAARMAPGLRRLGLPASLRAGLNRVCAPFADVDLGPVRLGHATCAPSDGGGIEVASTIGDGAAAVSLTFAADGPLLPLAHGPALQALRQELAWEAELAALEAVAPAVELTSVARPGPPLPLSRALRFETEAGAHLARLSFGAAAIPILAALFARLPARPGPARLPLRISVSLGGMELDRAALPQLVPGAALVPPASGASTRDVRLVLQGRPGPRATLDGPRLILKEPLMSTQPRDPVAPAPDPATALDRLPIRLDFVAGARRMELREAALLDVGSVVALDGDPTEADIDIQVDGVSIGRGEAVLIGGRLCIQIREMTLGADG